MRGDIKNAIDTGQSVPPGTHTASQDGSAVDLANFHAAAVVLDVGAYTDGTHDFTIEHAEDDGAGSPDTWETVPTDDLDGSLPTVDAAGDANTVTEVGYHGIRRHLRVTTTVSGTTNGAGYGVSVVRGKSRTQPV